MDPGIRMHAERTPNPNSIKWVLGQHLVEGGVGAHFDAKPAEEVSPFAARLFEIDGVTVVFLASNFVTITKQDDVEWTDLAQPIVDTLKACLASGAPKKVPDTLSDTLSAPCNHNGRYYTLPEVPEFDTHGLWRYRDISFSQHGNLTDTVVQLVKQSPAGLSGAELGQWLGLDPRPFLSFFRDHPALQREAHRGRFVYFCAESTIYRRQQSRRSTMPVRIEVPTDAQAIAILVQTIKHPDWSIEKLCAQLKRQGVKVSAEAVSTFFADHGLQIKKTPRSPS